MSANIVWLTPWDRRARRRTVQPGPLTDSADFLGKSGAMVDVVIPPVALLVAIQETLHATKLIAEAAGIHNGRTALVVAKQASDGDGVATNEELDTAALVADDID